MEFRLGRVSLTRRPLLASAWAGVVEGKTSVGLEYDGFDDMVVASDLRGLNIHCSLGTMDTDRDGR